MLESENKRCKEIKTNDPWKPYGTMMTVRNYEFFEGKVISNSHSYQSGLFDFHPSNKTAF